MIQIKLMGGFGNCIGQYVFARSLANHFGVELQTNDWIGRKIFQNINEKLINKPLPTYTFDQIPNAPNVCLHGYYQYQDAFNYMNKEQVLGWLKIKPEFNFKKEKFYTACHLRRGDYINLKHLFVVIDEKCYINAINKFGYNINDVVWISENTSGSPFPKGISFLYDFMRIMKADVIFRANSTFSYWAATLSAAKVYSPIIGDKIGLQNDIEFIEGNHCAIVSIMHNKSAVFNHTDMILN